MMLDGLRRVHNPYLMALISILVAEVAYIGVSLLFGFDLFPFWLTFTGVVSGGIAFVASTITTKLLVKIENQNDELARLNLLNQELFSTISHDIRTPLTGVTLLLEMVRTDSLNKDDADKLFDELSFSIEHLISFLDELLVWSKRQIDKKPLQPELVETKPIIESTIMLYSRIITMKELTLSVDSISGFMMVDKGSYSFVLRNVIQNAIKFTPKGGEIQLSVEQQNGHVITNIIDNGVGIPQSKIDNILAQGNYESTKGTDNETGVGFGLKASLNYLQKQDGTMSIISNENKGTKVSITLPKH
jgi:K+-sensing histidine kinase KdpD